MTAKVSEQGAISGLVRLTLWPLETLGPGKRFGIWLQGCSRHCPDCISKHTWDFDETFRLPLNDLAGKLRNHSPFTGRLTISGGEPFEQPDFLFHLLKEARNLGYFDILVYTGRYLKDLAEKNKNILEMIDALIDGPFEASLPTDLIWCGSANQRLHILSQDPAVRDLYQEYAETRLTQSRVQLVQTKAGLFLVGIPKDDKWKKLVHPDS